MILQVAKRIANVRLNASLKMQDFYPGNTKIH